MNPTPSAFRILCYGDSNTRGNIPGQKGPRYGADLRWTGRLQTALSESFEIIEEGLGGRTTTIDDGSKGQKNGKTYLLPCLESHNPLDMLILFLGTNDLKEKFSRSADDIASGIEELIQISLRFVASERILIICPSYVDEATGSAAPHYKGGTEKSKQLGPAYKTVTERYGCHLIDLGGAVEPSKLDGYHFDQAGHAEIARLIEARIRTITTIPAA